MNGYLLDASRELTATGQEHGVAVRALGGVGVLLHCPQALSRGPHREFADLDVAVPRDASRQAPAVFEAAGYEPDRRFNARMGDRRMIFRGPVGKVDVFVGAFEMCHRLDLSPRLALERDTLTASDLLMTKLQIVEVNQKDVVDAALLLSEHELGEGPGDHIDVAYLATLVYDDWGLWRTATQTLGVIAERRDDVAARAHGVVDALNDLPKGKRFRLRARVGERKRWYELPDEIE
jgi:Uncharacterised nucleotidyltransferase